MERRIIFCTYIVLSAFAILLLRLFSIQVIKGSRYREISDNNRLKVERVTAPRGIIYDRNGSPLVRNIPFFDISAVREYMPSDEETLLSLSALLNIEPGKLKAMLHVPAVKTYVPVKLRDNLSLSEVAMIAARKIDFPGLQVDVRTGREYIYGELAAHVSGYLNRLTPGQAGDSDYSGLPPDAFVGQYGVEKFHDDILRGRAGGRMTEVDAMGRETRVISFEEPSKGRDIRLTIDMPVQIEAEKNLAGRAGAVVAIDPQTGEILALASSPSFDPNMFMEGMSAFDWNMLVTDSKKPLLNRAIQSRYPPGSTFKVITALAALEEGVINDETKFHCKGSIEYGGREFKCWKKEGHGTVNLNRALAESCDVFFYEVGKRLDIDKLASYARRFGLGMPSGIGLNGEIAGLVPDSKWKAKAKKDKWYMGETLHTVIGQGYLTATPIEMAVVTSALVNGGRLVKPKLLMDDAGALSDSFSTAGVKPENLFRIKSALISSVNEGGGTGHLARSNITEIGGKTGTAQVVSKSVYDRNRLSELKDHAWFISFAPGDKPEIAVTVFIEHGGGGGAEAAPVAKNVIEAYFNAKAERLKQEEEKEKELEYGMGDDRQKADK
ncbi:MAG: penicillin-binding protein 2 [Nitrospirae bacterium]|nr:penicillin-binding protein 2 [Nitrospirota bacterium]